MTLPAPEIPNLTVVENADDPPTAVYDNRTPAGPQLGDGDAAFR